MTAALALLVLALGILLYRDRDFWFPDTREARELEEAPAPAPTAAQALPRTAPQTSPSQTPVRKRALKARGTTRADTAPAPQPAVVRTVLPPLEVEVVAGDSHRVLRPGSSSVRVDMQPASATSLSAAGTTAPLTDAAERVGVSTDASAVVTHTVSPDYPLLARQTKVQGSVILQALISREGDIQGLKVVSGSPILARAAQEAVRQWHFKPHYQGTETVETQAKITVNFTISTN